MSSPDHEADQVGLLVAETDLMVDSVNTVSEVLGRMPRPSGRSRRNRQLSTILLAVDRIRCAER